MNKRRLVILPVALLSIGFLSSCNDKEISSRFDDLQSQIDDIKGEITSLKTQIADLRKEMADADQAIKSEYDGKISEINETIASLNAQLEALNTQYQQDKETITNDYNTKINNLKEYTDGKILELNNKNTELNQQLTELSNKHDADKQALKEDYEAQLAALASSSQSERDRLEQDYNNKLNALNQAFSEAQTNLQNQITANKTAMETFASNYLTEKAAMELDYNTKINNLKTTYEAKVAEIESSIATCNSSIDTLRAEMNAALLASQNDYNAKINALTDRVAVLETETYHTVTFDTGLGSHVENQLIKHGEKITKPVDPTRPGFTFEGWTYNGNPWVFYGYVVSEDMTLTANWEYIDYTVTFKNDDGTVLETQTPVHYGDSVTYHGDIPVKPNPVDHYIYIFDGWDVDLTNIIGDTVAIAQYTAEYAPYTANFYDEEDNLLYSTFVKEGETAVYPLETPTKSDDNVNQLQFQFSGWDEINRTNDTVDYRVRFESCTLGLTFENCNVYQYLGNAKKVIIPSSWNGVTITSISEKSFEENNFIEELVIPSSVSSIGAYAFSKCFSLRQINIPDSVTSLGAYAFNNCTSLESITIPDSITKIPNGVFYCCTSLISIQLSNNLISIGSSSFSGTAIQSIVFPEGLISIGDFAFNSCERLQNITFSSTVNHLAYHAFGNSSVFRKIFIPKTLTTIERDAFYYMNGYIFAESNVKPKTWETGWNSTATVVWGYETTVVDGDYEFALGNMGITKVAYLIGCNPDIKDFELPASVNGYEVVYANLSPIYQSKVLERLVIPSYVEIIHSSAFYECSNMHTLEIESGLKIIEQNAFAYCSSLKTVIIPGSVSSIEGQAFSFCENLTSVYISNGADFIYDNAFRDDPKLTIYCAQEEKPQGWEENWARGINVKWYCDNLITIDGYTYCLTKESVNQALLFNFDENVADFELPNNVNGYEITYLNSALFTGNKTIKSVVLPNFVTNVDSNTFAECSALESIILPNTIVSIGERSFYKCSSLLRITIPEGVESIGSRAFYQCSALEVVLFPNTLTSIGASAFAECVSLKSVSLPNSVTLIDSSAFANCSSLVSATISNGVIYPGDSIFYNCTSLKTVLIPNSVKMIRYSAFANCVVTVVFYEGTASEWNSINIQSGNDCIKSATKYYYSETEPTEPGNYWHYVDGVPTIWE